MLKDRITDFRRVVICQRYAKLTGKTPIRESDGAEFTVKQAEVVHG